MSKQPVELFPEIISDPAILGGKPVIKGTRVPVALVLGKLAGGMSIDELLYEYYLRLEDVRAALGYAAQRVTEEEIMSPRNNWSFLVDENTSRTLVPALLEAGFRAEHIYDAGL